MGLPAEDDLLAEFQLFDQEFSIVAKYRIESKSFDMIYNKDKDLVMILRDGERIGLDKMSELEVRAYKEAMEICITFHHNRETKSLH